MAKAWQTLGIMVVVAASVGDARALTVTGGSGVDGLVLCNRYNSGDNRVYVAVCTYPYLTWVDVAENSTTHIIEEDVTLDGAGGADVVATFSGSGDPSVPCSITCFGEVQIGTHVVALKGGGAADYLWSSNDTGKVTFDGGTENDTMIHAGNYSGNEFDGGTGADIIVDYGSGGGGDWLYGGDGSFDDCLNAECLYNMDCGDGSSDKYGWAGVGACCSGDLCITPENCEVNAGCF
jgi:hypothetical protein